MTARNERKQLTHRAILDAAGRLLRARGIAGTGVSEVMDGARLTVGGFYAHFGSKARLIDEVLRRTSAQLREELFAGLGEKPAAGDAVAILGRYLSPAHRDAPTEGCPLPAVVGEIATTAPEHGRALRGEIEALAEGVGAHLPAQGGRSRRQLALATVALMYGGLALARALRGDALSDEVLKACRAAGAALLRAPPPSGARHSGATKVSD